MPSFISPDVTILERDLSPIAPGVAVNVMAFVGRAQWGPVWTRVQQTDEKEFAGTFGPPTSATYEDFFTMASFFKYATTAQFVRVVDPATAKNARINVTSAGAVAATSGNYIPDKDLYSPVYATELWQIFGKYPGVFGNTNIRVSNINYTTWNTPVAATSGFIPGIEHGPTTSDEYVVLVETLMSDGVSWEVAEQFLVSHTPGKKDSEGNNMYCQEKINIESAYILLYNKSTNTSSMRAGFGSQMLTYGNDGTPGKQNIIDAWDLFSNPEEVEVNYLVGGAYASADKEIALRVIEIAQLRADCFAIVDVPKSDVVGVAAVATQVANVINTRKAVLNSNTSYAALYANWLYIYDKYNDTYHWIPSGGHVAGIYAYTADTTDAWFAPAGLNRGILRGVSKIALNPKKSYRDSMYKEQVNPICSFPGQGVVVWGQKTMQTKASAFDRVNVRLLFLYMEKSLGKSAKYIVFEQNDNLTRAIFSNMAVPFLDDIKGRRGVYDFLVDVSDKVNTPERIDRNEFWAEIYVKPTKTAEFVVIRFTATKTGVDFAELA